MSSVVLNFKTEVATVKMFVGGRVESGVVTALSVKI
jgi:hypothetical protein